MHSARVAMVTANRSVSLSSVHCCRVVSSLLLLPLLSSIYHLSTFFSFVFPPVKSSEATSNKNRVSRSSSQLQCSISCESGSNLYRGITECYDIQLIDLQVSITILFILYKFRLHVSTIHVVILRSLTF